MLHIIFSWGISLRTKGGRKREKGNILLNRYFILDTLYSSENSRVYLSKHLSLDDYRIIKRLQKTLVCEECFHNEANVLKNLKHDGIPIIYDIEEGQDAYYIIEEYINGTSLYDYVKENGPMSEELAANFGVQICEIISYLHKQKPEPILYLDLKPQNLIVNNGKIYLVDFGNSMFVSANRRYMSGTKGYAAPEQYDFKGIGTSTDIYGIGAILYFMLKGTNLDKYEQKNLEFDSEMSEKFKKIIIQCMLPYDERIGDALVVATNLNEIIHEKIRKKRENKKENKNLGTPLTISVVGTEKHIGVTHLSLALASRLNEIGVRTMYEDCDGNVVRSIYKNCDKCRLSSGIYYYENIIMKNSYSEIVNLKEDVDCKILDTGRYNSQKIPKDSDFFIIVSGTKPWEIEDSLEIKRRVFADFDSDKIVFLSNFSINAEDKCIPVCISPFVRSADINSFLDTVINRVFKEENVFKEKDKKRIPRFFRRKK